MTSPVRSKRTEASPSSTMGKMRETDSQAFGSHVVPRIRKHVSVVVRREDGILRTEWSGLYLITYLVRKGTIFSKTAAAESSGVPSR